MAEQRPTPRKPETGTKSKEKTSPESETEDLSPEELKQLVAYIAGEIASQLARWREETRHKAESETEDLSPEEFTAISGEVLALLLRPWPSIMAQIQAELATPAAPSRLGF
jgi:hypothetical protein